MKPIPVTWHQEDDDEWHEGWWIAVDSDASDSWAVVIVAKTGEFGVRKVETLLAARDWLKALRDSEPCS